MKKIRIISIIISILLIAVMLVNLTGCSTQVQAADLMNKIEATPISDKAADEMFLDSQMRLAVALFQATVQESKNKNMLLSPLSIQLALAMTTNGADGKTREEMEALLGGTLSIEALNAYLYTYVKSLPSADQYKLKLANSIWFRDSADLTVEKDFLQTNANYYGAQIYQAPFNMQTVQDMNNWVKLHTDGMIDKIIEVIDADTVLYLINALMFDAEWEKAYTQSDVYDGVFTTQSGSKNTVAMMRSDEQKYLDDGKAIGFVKDYKDGKYSFAALLPNEGVDIYDYIAGLTGDGLADTLRNVQQGLVLATMPKFSYGYELRLNDALAGLGMPTAFSAGEADFSKAAKSVNGNLFIDNVLHKTFISVDELGTRAGAVTAIEVKTECAPHYKKIVRLDRPFVYMIVDNATNLPIFLGTVVDIQK